MERGSDEKQEGGEIKMPFTRRQKSQLIAPSTEAMMRHLGSVVIEEVTSGDWGIGSKPIQHN
jgi:phenylpyruvate tautomerase PptA (4-oxalocrotonate tautomerase family)